MSPLQENSSEMDPAVVHGSDYQRKNRGTMPLHFPLSPRKTSRRGTSLPPSDHLKNRDKNDTAGSSSRFPLLPLIDSSLSLLLPIEKKNDQQTPCHRRRIFSGVIKNNPIPSQQLSSPTQCPRKVIDFGRFTPSPEFLHDSRERYKPIVKLPPSYEFLPPIPTPLKRLYREDGSAACLMGAYPMQRLPSILRHSTYHKQSVTSANENFEKLTESQTNQLTLHQNQPISRKESNPVCIRNNKSDPPSSCGSNRVFFDPRITVIEFKNDFQRQWISNAELERFKKETIILAENYLRRHPEMIEKYSVPIRDSITLTLRRRALYSLPVMSHCESEDSDRSTESDGSIHSEACDDAAG